LRSIRAEIFTRNTYRCTSYDSSFFWGYAIHLRTYTKQYENEIIIFLRLSSSPLFLLRIFLLFERIVGVRVAQEYFFNFYKKFFGKKFHAQCFLLYLLSHSLPIFSPALFLCSVLSSYLLSLFLSSLLLSSYILSRTIVIERHIAIG
jgi:hypothetical protein